MSVTTKQAVKIGSRAMDAAANALIDRLATHAANCPYDGHWPGFRLTPKTRREYARAERRLNSQRRPT